MSPRVDALGGVAARTTLRRLCAATATAVHIVVRAWRERRRQAATRAELARLDDATLRDLGLHRSEVASVAAELHGVAVATRRLALASRRDPRPW